MLKEPRQKKKEYIPYRSVVAYGTGERGDRVRGTIM